MYEDLDFPRKVYTPLVDEILCVKPDNLYKKRLQEIPFRQSIIMQVHWAFFVLATLYIQQVFGAYNYWYEKGVKEVKPRKEKITHCCALNGDTPYFQYKVRY